MAAYSYFTNNTLEGRTQLANTLLSSTNGLLIDANSIALSYGTFSAYDYMTQSYSNGSSISYYDGSITSLGIGSGLLLSSGDAKPTSTNSSSSYGKSLTMASGSDSDTDFTNVAKAAFSGSGTSHDSTWMEFDFTVADPYNTKGITFDLVFGSDEYPEYSNSSYVDIAGVFLNGTNIALFNSSATNPLSVTQSNVNLGYFNNNALGAYPVEYDGISNKLTIYAPLQPGTNTLKIGVADTGDHVYDSGLYISNLKATQFGGSGLSSVRYGTESNDNYTGTENGETFDLGAGDDTIDPGYGDDVVLAGFGNDIIYGGKGENQFDGGAGEDSVMYNYDRELAYVKVMDNGTIHVGANSDTLLDVETISFADGTYDTNQLFIEDNIAKVYVAYFGRAADPQGMQYWLGDINSYLSDGATMNQALKNIIDSFAHSTEAESMYPGMNSGALSDQGLSAFIESVYQNLFDRVPDEAGAAYWLNDAKIMQNSGVAVGTLIKTIIDGALDTVLSLDRTLIQNKAQVAWDYAKQYQLHNTSWDASMSEAAKTLIDSITTDHQTVNNAYIEILGVVHPGAMPIA